MKSANRKKEGEIKKIIIRAFALVICIAIALNSSIALDGYCQINSKRLVEISNQNAWCQLKPDDRAAWNELNDKAISECSALKTEASCTNHPEGLCSWEFLQKDIITIPALKEAVPKVPPEGGYLSIVPGADGKLSRSQITEIQDSLQLQYTPKIESAQLELNKAYFVIENRGDKIIKNIDITVEKPESEKEKLVVMHPFKVFGWEIGSMTGLYVADAVKEPKLLEWNVDGESHGDELKPGESLESKFDIKTPLTTKKKIELHVKIKSYNQIIFDKIIEVGVEETKIIIVSDADKEKERLDVYMVIANQKSRDVTFNVELSMDEITGKYTGQELSVPENLKEAAKHLKAVFAEYYGPYKVKAFDTVLLAHQYKYNENFEKDYILKAVLYENDRKLAEAEGRMNLKKE